MKIKLMSDLHCEFGVDLYDYIIPPCRDADVIILAGDIHVGAKATADVLNKFAEVYPHVVFVPGNHEYYKSSILEFNKQLPRLLKSNVSNLQEQFQLCVGDVTFFGDTLWTNFGGDYLAEHSAKTMISDFRVIKNFTPTDAVRLYETCLEHLKFVYETTPGKKVIVTHFLPASECTHPRYKDGGLLNKYFANDLGDWIKELQDTTWCFGHTHDSMDFMLGDTRMLCNPAGYMGENKQFNKGFIFDV